MKVQRQIIDSWIERHDPNGLLKLAEAAGIGFTTVQRARVGQVPKKYHTRRKLCDALGVAETELFPGLETGVS